jgi:hypothetical protein
MLTACQGFHAHTGDASLPPAWGSPTTLACSACRHNPLPTDHHCLLLRPLPLLLHLHFAVMAAVKMRQHSLLRRCAQLRKMPCSIQPSTPTEGTHRHRPTWCGLPCTTVAARGWCGTHQAGHHAPTMLATSTLQLLQHVLVSSPTGSEEGAARGCCSTAHLGPTRRWLQATEVQSSSTLGGSRCLGCCCWGCCQVLLQACHCLGGQTGRSPGCCCQDSSAQTTRAVAQANTPGTGAQHDA